MTRFLASLAALALTLSCVACAGGGSGSGSGSSSGASGITMYGTIDEGVTFHK
ncbi:hypothetical protein [Paraburkholderia acidisoli]|uniref:hypothetical protein n=1 Tax=Paraburkholderia acidisoli TaxID=2571748 RepID=UPI0018EF28A8|nr:hypothetical protein [Paraburkholderia acidisoli]